jgi:hypothetical protein
MLASSWPAKKCTLPAPGPGGIPTPTTHGQDTSVVLVLLSCYSNWNPVGSVRGGTS